MKQIFIFIAILTLNACSQTDTEVAAEIPETTAKTYTILALGDSLTEGLGVAEKDNYPSILASFLAADIKVINAGLSGETSSGLKNRLNWVLKQKPDLTILNIGANDAMRGLPLSLTEQNIDEIITEIKNAHSDVILAGMQIYENLGQEYTEGFSQLYPRLAKKHGIGLIPFFLDHVAGDVELNQADLLHPNAKGYKIIVERNILPIVQPYLKK
jgi:acyl-CoA thioesterase-1